jgi:protease-4
MKQFFTNVAANLVTVALLVLVALVLVVGLVASATRSTAPGVPDDAILVVDLSQPLADRPTERTPSSAWDRALAEPGGSRLSLRGAVIALTAAATDDRISGVLLRGTVLSDGLSSGYGGLLEFREAITRVVAAGKPVHAYLVDPGVRDYYVASAASTITLDPFGTLNFGGLSATQVHVAGFLEKYGIGVQVSRVGKFKAAIEPFTRLDMSPENRAQTQRYLDATWSAVKRGVAESRRLDTLQLQRLADSVALFLPAEAARLGLVDRVAHFDVLLADLQRLTAGNASPARAAVDTSAPPALTTDRGSAPAPTGNTDSSPARITDPAPSLMAMLPSSMPQVLLRDYARLAVNRAEDPTARRKIAIVYAQGEIVNGEGGMDQVGGQAFARELRALRGNRDVKAVVLRINSPGGSVVASEEIQRELVLLDREKPVVASMGTLAASGGYWIATPARRVFAQPATLTGSIGVFAIFPNLQGIARKNGITVDTVRTGQYADLFGLSRPRSDAELAIIQRSVDAVYDAFLARVAQARRLPIDSVRAIAEGRVWAGGDALALGLVDEMGDLDAALRHAATLADLGDTPYGVLEVPKVKNAGDVLQELFDDSPPPVVGRLRAALGLGAAMPVPVAALPATGPMAVAVQGLVRELGALLRFDDPRGVYARLPYALHLP